MWILLNAGTSPNFSVTVTNNNVTTTANGISAISLNAERVFHCLLQCALEYDSGSMASGCKSVSATPVT